MGLGQLFFLSNATAVFHAMVLFAFAVRGVGRMQLLLINIMLAPSKESTSKTY